MSLEKFRVTLPNEKQRGYNFVSLFILLINLFLCGSLYLNVTGSRIVNVTFIGAVVCIVELSLLAIKHYTNNRYSLQTGISFFILAFIWIIVGKYLLAASMLCFAIIGIYARRALVIIFNDDQIIYPGFPVKHILWMEVSNVILKDGMLTIDLKNNTLIQAVISKESAEAINERELNLFCKHAMASVEIK